MLPNGDRRVALPETDRQYHIDLAPGELADLILLPGDPARIERIAGMLDTVEVRRDHREFASVTGSRDGTRISAVSTGIGTDNVEITLAEILALVPQPTLIRIGSCGVLRPDIALGDLVITTGAVRLESTTSWYVHDGYPAVPHYAAVAALVEAAATLGHTAHLGVTATAPGFYGPQGRPIPQLPIRYPDLAAELAAQGVVNFEMEASALLVLAALAGARAGVVCTAFAQRNEGRFLDGAGRAAAELACIETGMVALRILSEMDERTRAAGASHWRPSLWPAMMST
jgi:uridine phosphorylase